MDDILYKNIFNDQDLYKLSPDYRPKNVLLRMQLRRTSVKDTHKHHSHSSISRDNHWSRKSMKKSRDHYNVHKDLLKLRNDFMNINLKNQMRLKCLDSLKAKSDDELLNGYADDSIEEKFLLHDFSDDKIKLMICSDTDFKLNTKSKSIKLPKPNRNNGKHQDFNHISNESDVERGTLENGENILKVKCIYSNKTIQDESTNESIIIKQSNKHDLRRDSSVNNVENQESDLQKLLIMMAVSSKPNNSDEKFKGVELTNNVSLQDENLSHIRDNNHLTSSKCDEIEHILSVIPIRVELNNKEKVIIKKFVNKWKQYVQNRKKYVNEQRRATLNNFFDKITKKKQDMNQGQEPENKAKQFVRDYNTYQHRYKVQKHIIALQKAKLEEQNRCIEELKYNKIIEASRQSVEVMRDEVRKTYYEIDRQLKPKIKCLTNELKIHEIEEPSLVLHCLKVPQFLQRMEKRAREREEKHAIIRERRRQVEEERVRLKQQAELAKSEMDKEEKIKRMKELKEKRKREKIENIRRKQYAERMRALIVMADLHYEKTLMARYCIRPLRLLIEIKCDNIEKARAHYRFQLKNNIFLHWMWHTEDMWFERNYKAEELYRKNLLSKVFEGFKMYHYDYILRRQVAEDYYDLYLTQLVFKKLRQGVELLKREHEVKLQKAVVYHSSNLLFKAFTCWRTLPALNALKREQEARKARWREKVLQVVPDYTPPEE